MATAAHGTHGSEPTWTASLVIGRPRLESRLDEAFGKRLTLVVAGAGFGKSTLLTEWARDLEAIVYTVTPQDASLASVKQGLTAAFQARLPETGATLVESQSGRAGADDIAGADAFAGHLCELLARELRHDLVLVLDDVHEVGDGPGSARLPEALCRQAPPMVHIVLGSRAGPPFPIERLRGQGGQRRCERSRGRRTSKLPANWRDDRSRPASSSRRLATCAGSWSGTRTTRRRISRWSRGSPLQVSTARHGARTRRTSPAWRRSPSSRSRIPRRCAPEKQSRRLPPRVLVESRRELAIQFSFWER